MQSTQQTKASNPIKFSLGTIKRDEEKAQDSEYEEELDPRDEESDEYQSEQQEDSDFSDHHNADNLVRKTAALMLKDYKKSK